MVGKTNGERDAGISLRWANEPVSELRIEARDDSIERRRIGISQYSSRFELRPMILVDQIRSDTIEHHT